MNPIMTMLKKSNGPQLSSDLTNLINLVKSGKVDAREKSLETLKAYSPQQRQAIKELLPKITQLGKALGVPDESIKSFTKDIQSVL